LALANRNGGVGEEGPGVRKGQQGPPILILLWLEVGRRETKIKNRKRESCQLEAG